MARASFRATREQSGAESIGGYVLRLVVSNVLFPAIGGYLIWRRWKQTAESVSGKEGGR